MRAGVVAASPTRNEDAASVHSLGRPPLVWLDRLKGVALLWVVLNHVSERAWGGAFAGNPAADWPPMSARMAQWAPIHTGNVATDIVASLVRMVGWTGDQGVTLFLILSGLGLAYGLACKNTPAVLQFGVFYRARALRLYPQWWAANAIFAVAAWATGRLAKVEHFEFLLGLLGIRATAKTIYFLVPAWWYVGLILQLYLIFPLLWWLARRWGTMRMLITCVAIGFAARAIGPLVFHGFIDEWLRGAFFVTRLPEFALGIALGIALTEGPERFARILRSRATVGVAAASLALGFGLSFTLAGMSIAPFLMGAGSFALGYAALAGSRTRDILAWFGRHSYALYLVHQPFVNAMLPAGESHLSRIFACLAAVLTASVLAALFLERITTAIAAHLRLSALVGAGGLATVYGLNALVTAVAPQEVYGWGERPSLLPDPVVGWKLAPSRTSRLRWQTYDYVMKANALGFPAPEVPTSKAPGVTRIMALGNAFTSGDGMDPNLVWPRLLERELAAKNAPAQVLNFGITGHGPNQFTAVARTYAPLVRPDIIIVQMFTKEFGDVLISDATFRREIGFGEPDPQGFRTTAEAMQLAAYLRNTLGDRVRAALHQPLKTKGAILANVDAFDRQRPELQRSRALVAERLAEIQAQARRLHARFFVVMVPASVQVCNAAELPYYPNGVFSDTARYDLDLPQRMTREITAQAGIQFLDLRAALKNGPCPYWRTNMHWTSEGHRRASEAIARMILATHP